jgi:ribosomal protein S18 acetylase RimI-like enzyme
MSAPDAIEVVAIDLDDEATAAAVLAVQRRGYKIEADLIGFEGIPPLNETLEQLQESDESFLGAQVRGQLAGIVSWKLDGDTIDIHRLAVDPAYFRRGIGARLVRSALAAEPGAARATVQTGALNEPARALYRREGFELDEEIEVAPRVKVARFVKVVN